MLGKGSLAGDRVRSRTMVPSGESRSQSGSLSCQELVSISSSVGLRLDTGGTACFFPRTSPHSVALLMHCLALSPWLPFTQFPTLTVPHSSRVVGYLFPFDDGYSFPELLLYTQGQEAGWPSEAGRREFPGSCHGTEMSTKLGCRGSPWSLGSTSVLLIL